MTFWAAITKKENLAWYFLVLAAFAVFYSQERILNIDCSNFLFHIINFNTFCFPESRMGVFLTQLPLLAGVNLHAPLAVLVPLFSASFIAVYLLIFWICLKPLNNPVAAVAILLSLVAGMRTSFFHPVTETHQALVYTSLLYAWISNTRYTGFWIKNTVAVIIIAWCALTHPISLFTVGFVLAYYLVSSNRFREPAAYIPVAAMALVFGIKVLSTGSGYDAEQYSQLKNFSSYIPRFFTLPPVEFLWYRFSRIYFVPLALFIYNTIVLLRQRNFLLAVLHGAGVLVFMLISIFTFHAGDNDPMMEKSFLPGIYMIVFTFAALHFSGEQRKAAAATLVAHAIVLYGLVGFILAGKAYTERINYFKSILAYQHSIQEPKLVVAPENLNPAYFFNEWSFSIDLMVLSKIQGDEEAYTAHVISNPDLVKEYGVETNPDLYLHVNFWPYVDIHALNRDYFNVPSHLYYILPKNIRL